eukprot:596338-Rhodomonas_salina.1
MGRGKANSSSANRRRGKWLKSIHSEADGGGCLSTGGNKEQGALSSEEASSLSIPPSIPSPGEGKERGKHSGNKLSNVKSSFHILCHPSA